MVAMPSDMLSVALGRVGWTLVAGGTPAAAYVARKGAQRVEAADPAKLLLAVWWADKEARTPELSHQGDPCRHCGTPHDAVAPGACPGKVNQSVGDPPTQGTLPGMGDPVPVVIPAGGASAVVYPDAAQVVAALPGQLRLFPVDDPPFPRVPTAVDLAQAERDYPAAPRRKFKRLRRKREMLRCTCEDRVGPCGALVWGDEESLRNHLVNHLGEAKVKTFSQTEILACYVPARTDVFAARS